MSNSWVFTHLPVEFKLDIELFLTANNIVDFKQCFISKSIVVHFYWLQWLSNHE